MYLQMKCLSTTFKLSVRTICCRTSRHVYVDWSSNYVTVSNGSVEYSGVMGAVGVWR